MKYTHIYTWVALLGLIAGCTVGPVYEPPCMEIEEEWNQPLCESMTTEAPECFLWWDALNDPILNELMSRAALSNLDLSIAAMRILEARAEEKGGSSALYPHVDATAAYGHARYNPSLLRHLLDVECSKGSRKKHVNFFEVGFDAEWEIDLFGMTAHELCALQAKTEAARQEFYHLWVTLSAEVAKNYMTLRGLQLNLQLTERNIAAQHETLNLTKDLIQAGFASTLDEKQAEEQLNILGAKKADVKLEINKTMHRLAILLGGQPGELNELLCEAQPLPTLPCEQPIGIPSELLRRRPDIQKAERELAAATENVGSAVAALFPRLSLRGFIGDLGTFHTGSYTWFAGPQLLQPLFNSKALQQDVCLNKIRAEQALYVYEKTVLQALEETENAIATFHAGVEKNALLGEAQRNSQEAHSLAMELYEKGLKDYLEVLVIYRSYLTNQETYLQNQVELLADFIALYKALAGGWEISYCIHWSKI